MAEKFTLNWYTFTDHLQLMLKDLYEEGKYSDITLVCDDQTQFKAHKIVLRACSPVLKKIIDNNSRQHPLIYLRGIHSYELVSILQFMYLGEGRSNYERMEEFIKVAKDLEVGGISDGVEMQNEEEEIIDDVGEIIAENEIEQTVKEENEIKVETKMRQQRSESQFSNDVEENSWKAKKKIKEEVRAAKRELYGQASEAFKRGLYPSLNSCASAYNVSRKTLGRMITSNREYIGGGRKSGSSGKQ